MKLERFAWSHWIRKYQIYFELKFRPRPQAGPEGPQLPKTSPRKNGKPSISRMAQKIELIIRLFSGIVRGQITKERISDMLIDFYVGSYTFERD